jgi:hypothetical protein
VALFCLEITSSLRTTERSHGGDRIPRAHVNMHATVSASFAVRAPAAPGAPRRARRAATRRADHVFRASETDADGPSASEISDAMAAARACEAGGLSPGAGLKDAEAQAEAAFADMINTTVDVTGENLGSDALEELARGGTMDAASKGKKSGSLLDDVVGLFGALSKGAHIVKQKNGRV